MWSDVWMALDNSLGVPMLARVMSERVTYRLHLVNINMAGNSFVAKVYAGSALVYTTQGYNEFEALERAKAWIDEQEEAAPAYDLHTI
jgi:hypothetical protein